MITILRVHRGGSIYIQQFIVQHARQGAQLLGLATAGLTIIMIWEFVCKSVYCSARFGCPEWPRSNLHSRAASRRWEV